jgi:DNA repair protein RecO (recombination protein O)
MNGGKHASDRIRKVEAIVISHRDFGEADRLVKIFSLENGKLNTLAKGVRKIHSRKGPHLEPFTYASLVLARGQSFWIITQADTISAFPSIKEDLTKIGEASYVLELLEIITTEGQPEASLFKLILDTLNRISECTDAYNTVRYFELRFLDIGGFRPELTNCVACKKVIEAEDQFFSPVQGGALCPGCGSFDQSAIRISVDVLRYLRHFQRSNFADINKIVVPEMIRMEMQKVLSVYISSIIERKLNTPSFLRQIEKKSRIKKSFDIQ